MQNLYYELYHPNINLHLRL